MSRNEQWSLDALCRGMPNEWFYNSEIDPNRKRFVKALCKMCPVRGNCIDAAVTSKSGEEGYWGIDSHVYIELSTKNPLFDNKSISSVAIQLSRLECPK